MARVNDERRGEMGIHPEGKGEAGCFRTVALVIVPVAAAVTLFTCEWGAGAKGAPLPSRPAGVNLEASSSPVPRRPVCSATVPNVVGMTEPEARAALEAAKLIPYVWMNKGGAQEPTWVVILSDPVAGTVVNRCTDPIVEIWIDQG